MLDFLSEIDQKLFLFLNGLHNPFLDPVMLWVSGKLSWIPLYLLIMFLIIRKYKWRSLWVLLFIAILITLSDQISVRAFKMVFMRPRPCHEELLKDVIHLVNNKCGGSFGFVSSHAANSFALAVFTLLLFRNDFKWIVPAMLFWAGLVAYSRVYLGVHYPGDILGGALLGSLLGLLFYHLFRYLVPLLCKT